MADSDRSSSERRSTTRSPGVRLGDLTAVLAVTVVAALFVKTFVLDASHIPSRSMMDVLRPGDYILVNKLLYGPRVPVHLSAPYGPLPAVRLPALRDPRRGDIVVFWYSSHGGPEGFRSARQYVKRCVGVPGDTVVTKGGTLWVNGRAVVGLEGDSTSDISIVIPRPGDSVALYDRSPGLLRELVRRDRELTVDEEGGGGAADVEASPDPEHGSSIGIAADPARTAVEATQTDESAVGSDDSGGVTDHQDAPVPQDGGADIHVVHNEFFFVLGDRPSLSIDSRHMGLIPRPWIIGTPIAVYWSIEPGSVEGGLVRRLEGIRWSRFGHLVR